jgi:transcriptional regulator with XRE-family HTH domain
VSPKQRGQTEWERDMGQRLQQLRQAKGLSQTQLALAAGVPVGSLRNWERGRRVPLLDAAARIAVALGISLDTLAGIEPEMRGSGKKK